MTPVGESQRLRLKLATLPRSRRVLARLLDHGFGKSFSELHI